MSSSEPLSVISGTASLAAPCYALWATKDTPRHVKAVPGHRTPNYFNGMATGNGENLTAIATKDTKNGAMMLRPGLGHKATIKDTKIDKYIWQTPFAAAALFTFASLVDLCARAAVRS